jgi:hypothetical protein
VKFLLNSWNFAGHFGWRPQPVAYPTLSGHCRTNERFGTLTWKPIVFPDRRHSHEEIRELSRMAGVLHGNLAARWDQSGRQGISGRPRRQRRAYHPRRVEEEQNVERWGRTSVHQLSEIRIEEPASAYVGVNGARCGAGTPACRIPLPVAAARTQGADIESRPRGPECATPGSNHSPAREFRDDFELGDSSRAERLAQSSDSGRSSIFFSPAALRSAYLRTQASQLRPSAISRPVKESCDTSA